MGELSQLFGHDGSYPDVQFALGFKVFQLKERMTQGTEGCIGISV